MNTSLLFSSFPFITGPNVTLSRMTDMDAEALWEVLGDEENFRYRSEERRVGKECL